jgi:hypothetical protein
MSVVILSAAKNLSCRKAKSEERFFALNQCSEWHRLSYIARRTEP